MAALHRQAAEAYSAMLSAAGGTDGGEFSEVLERMVQQLREGAEMPPRNVQGVSQEFLDTLDRVPTSLLKKKRKEDAVCPICSVPFLEDPFPLVVRLPCHPGHVFDLECVGPWLRVNGTCPLDRKPLGSRKEVVVEEKEEEDDDGEYDDYYA